MKRLVLICAVLAAGCGSTPSLSSTSAPTVASRTTATVPTPTTTPTPTPNAQGPAFSTCSYLKPAASNCEQPPAAGSCHFRANAVGVLLPDARCTPGALNPAVTATTARTTICKSGYTSRIRPPVSYTGPLKRKLMAAYGLKASDAAQYELDHLVPLEGGGAPSDPANLWPQPYAPTPGAHQKDSEENYLRSQACGTGIAKLAFRQIAIAADWIALAHADNPPPQSFGSAAQ